MAFCRDQVERAALPGSRLRIDLQFTLTSLHTIVPWVQA